jgi:FMN phosphatase YigB (HAD superfamily)
MDEVILTPALHHPPGIMEAAAETLASVKALGIPTALISNAGVTPGFVLRRLLYDAGMLAHLDVTVFSDEVEMSKPHPAIFERALDELGFAPEDAAFVGDDPVLDVFGARRAGLWMVQIGDLASVDAEPHARIGTLPELLPALRGLGLLA